MQLLATCSCGLSGVQGKKALTNGDLASTAQQADALHFHTEILFKRILVSKYLRIFMEKWEEEPRLPCALSLPQATGFGQLLPVERLGGWH